MEKYRATIVKDDGLEKPGKEMVRTVEAENDEEALRQARIVISYLDNPRGRYGPLPTHKLRELVKIVYP